MKELKVESVKCKTAESLRDKSSFVGGRKQFHNFTLYVFHFTLSFAAFAANAAGVTVQTAPKGTIYNDEHIVTNVVFDATGLATKTELNSHANNQNIHVTAAKQAAWNAKQDALPLETGTGASSLKLKVSGNGATTASGDRAVALGYAATASGQNSAAFNNQTTASGQNSAAFGYKTAATNNGEIAAGVLNNPHNGTRFSVGIGVNATATRTNAVEVMANGDVYVRGVGGYTGGERTIPANGARTLQEEVAAIREAAMNALPNTGGTIYGSLTVQKDNYPLTIRAMDSDRDFYGLTFGIYSDKWGFMHKGIGEDVDDPYIAYLPERTGTLALTDPNPTAGNLAALDAQGNPTDSLIPATNVAKTSELAAAAAAATNYTDSVTNGLLRTETDPTISAWAKAASKPSYTAAEVGATTPADVAAAIREQSLGGIWDAELEVWWTPRMRNGCLTYEATTNVNLNAEN